MEHTQLKHGNKGKGHFHNSEEIEHLLIIGCQLAEFVYHSPDLHHFYPVIHPDEAWVWNWVKVEME